MAITDAPGGVVDHLFGLENSVQVAGGSPCAVREGHRSTANQEQIAVGSPGFQLVCELIQQRDDVIPGQHRFKHSPVTGDE
ncbi:MAG TPA: hypothetical protein VFC13_06695 [Actinomycetes bacterium]|jgi:hypothetical protein|nr:hypothetical protein [Actinomycetes bacterium]